MEDLMHTILSELRGIRENTAKMADILADMTSKSAQAAQMSHAKSAELEKLIAALPDNPMKEMLRQLVKGNN